MIFASGLIAFIATPSRSLSALVAAAVVLTVPLASQAQTRNKAADVGAYCRDRYGPTATPGIDRRDNALLCTARGSGGLALQHYRVRPSNICRAQHRTSRYRRSGTRVTCLVRTADRRDGPPDDGRARERAVSLAAYCRRAYGPDATLTRRRTDDRPMCSVRTDRGLALRHHLIDPRRVCDGQRYRMAGSRVYCAVAKGRPPSDRRRDEARTIDLAAYCRSTYGPDAFLAWPRSNDPPLCSVRTDRGLGLRHHNVDLARLCGTRRYRVRNNQLFCGVRPDRPPERASRVTTIDLRDFCRRAFGPSAELTRRRTDGRPMCTVRTDGGLGLRHHAIDPERACRGRRYRIDGDRLLCVARN